MSTIKVRPMDEPPDDLIEHPGSMASLHYAEVATVAEDVGSAVPQVSGKYGYPIFLYIYSTASNEKQYFIFS